MIDHTGETEADDPIDFSALGPPVARHRLDALIAHAALLGDEELQRRRGGAAVVRLVVAWRRPVLAFSGLAAAAAIALLVRSTPAITATETTTAPNTVAEALGIPSGFAQSVEGSAVSSLKSGTEKP